MHPDLEALICAYDAVQESHGEEAIRRRAILFSRLDHVLAEHPNLSRESLRNAVRLAHQRWLRAQQRPPTLPPAA
jgi:ribosomal 50S subunit-associated protein YjgA (DUF615 family)